VGDRLSVHGGPYAGWDCGNAVRTRTALRHEAPQEECRLRTKVFGFWIAFGGTVVAAWLISRIGMMSSLLIGTVAGSASHLALALLAAHGDDGGKAFWTFALAVGIDGFAYAIASIVLVT
jgi:hypothetical protein